MVMVLRIHIFCGATNLCKLIKKSFLNEYFIFNCTEVKEKQENGITESINYRPDCIIVDKDIESILRDKIVKRFSNSKIILLPALNEVEYISNSKNVYQISEPFKLSELKEILSKLYQLKQSEETNS